MVAYVYITRYAATFFDDPVFLQVFCNRDGMGFRDPGHAMVGDHDEVDVLGNRQLLDLVIELVHERIDHDNGLSRFLALGAKSVPVGIRLLEISHDQMRALFFWLL